MNLLQQNRHVRRALVYGVSSFFVMCFIFSQSILSMESSGDLSAGFMAIIKPLLDPKGIISEEFFHHCLRKAAHFTEFAVFGCLFCCFAVNLGRVLNKRFVVLALYIPLVVAVCDEFIQYFTGRGSMVTDGAIDYLGGLSGVLLIWLILRIRNQKHSQ